MARSLRSIARIDHVILARIGDIKYMYCQYLQRNLSSLLQIIVVVLILHLAVEYIITDFRKY